jgi:hypothetical protein
LWIAGVSPEGWRFQGAFGLLIVICYISAKAKDDCLKPEHAVRFDVTRKYAALNFLGLVTNAAGLLCFISLDLYDKWVALPRVGCNCIG